MDIELKPILAWASLIAALGFLGAAWTYLNSNIPPMAADDDPEEIADAIGGTTWKLIATSAVCGLISYLAW